MNHMNQMKHNADGNRYCPKCQMYLPNKLFNKWSYGKNGLAVYCKTCDNKRKHDLWLKRKHDATFVANNNARSREHYYAVREERLQQIKKYAETHREYYRRYSKNWRRNHAEKVHYYQIIHKKHASHEFLLKDGITLQQLMTIVKHWNHHCAYCGLAIEGKYKVDYIMPIIRGGKHSADNILIICHICGKEKSNKTVAEFGYRVYYKMHPDGFKYVSYTAKI